MSYVDGFIIPAEDAKKDAFIEHAKTTDAFFIKYGALSIVECWEDDVPEGKVTDFRKAVAIKDGEKVVFSWIVWPDKDTRDKAFKAMTDDADMMAQPMPFDGKRMIYGGFVPVIEETWKGGEAGYVDGFVAAVTPANKDAYIKMGREAAEGFAKWGALYDLENWGDDVPHGTLTDYYRSVQAEGDEVIVFSFIGWPDKATRDAGWAEMMKMDPPSEMPFDGKRMYWGGFKPFLALKG